MDKCKCGSETFYYKTQNPDRLYCAECNTFQTRHLPEAEAESERAYPLLGEVRALVDAQNSYINFLTEHIGNRAGFLLVHNIQTSQDEIDKGNKLREKIENYKNKLSEHLA